MKKKDFLFLAVAAVLAVSGNTAIWGQEGPKTAEDFNTLGNFIADKHKDYDVAIKAYTEAIRLDPNYTVSYFNRGTVYYQKEDYDRAIADLTQAIRLNPNYADAYYVRGVSYYEKKDYEKAITDFETALRLNPNNAAAKQWLDSARQQRGR